MKKLIIILLLLLPSNIEAQLVIAPTTSGGSGSSSAWGTITGTLSNQTDLQAALDLKAPLASPSFTTQVTLGGVASPYFIINGSVASDSDMWMGLTSDSGGDDDDFFELGYGTTGGTTPQWRFGLTATDNNKVIYHNIHGNGTGQYGRFVQGPATGAAIYNLMYQRAGGEAYRHLRVGQMDSGDFLEIYNNGESSNELQWWVNSALIWYGSNTYLRSATDGAIALGTSDGGWKATKAYKFICSSTTGPTGAGDTSGLATGSAACAGKATSNKNGAASITITFNGTAFTNAPACWANNNTSGVALSAASTTTVLTIAGVTSSGDVISYGCVGFGE